ncbi:hypothetical protein ACFVMC_12815 [Nocardia sp. NPDC127579]|uniref:hypothetical protein n=1 Tax=Nocardia sp. NPDC127579 TaxID=3345402 RepID=UPI00362FBC43
MRNPKLWLAALALALAPLAAAAPAAATGLPLTPTEEPAVIDQQQPCVNYPGNIPCNLSTFSAQLGIGR